MVAVTDWSAMWVAVVAVIATWGINRLTVWVRWMMKRRREELDSQVLAKIDDKLATVHEKQDDLASQLRAHTDQEAEIVKRVVSEAVTPIIGRLDALAAETDRRFDTLDRKNP